MFIKPDYKGTKKELEKEVKQAISKFNTNRKKE